MIYIRTQETTIFASLAHVLNMYLTMDVFNRLHSRLGFFFFGQKLNTCILYEPNVHFFDHSFVHVTVNVSITQ